MPNLDLILANLDDSEKALVDKVIEAGKLVLEYWPGAGKQDLDISEKSDGSFVTEADFKSNEILMAALEEIYPGVTICSEEVEFQTDDYMQDIWYVDPLDGTSNFIAGKDDFLVLLGLCSGGRPVKGIAYYPARDILCFAAKGRGAFSSEVGKLQVSQDQDILPVNTSVRKFNLDGFSQLGLHSGEAQYQLARGDLVACAIKLGTSSSPKSWDFAPFEILIRESGGQVSDQNNQAILYQGESLTADYYLASNTVVHEHLLEKINA